MLVYRQTRLASESVLKGWGQGAVIGQESIRARIIFSRAGISETQTLILPFACHATWSRQPWKPP